jgi:hypothetical protein
METNNKLREAIAQQSVDDADTAACILYKFPEDVCEERMTWSELCDMAYNLAAGFTTLRNAVKATLAAPPRNCDRPECATTKAAQDVWHKEDGGKTAYYEWLLATYKEGGNDGR